ncbi:hypothetical protein [Chryseobacterium sp. BIGb0232]|uniref:hypothetical protein n=1 Tax=Chryseobacterium sp. BIGb0232 TaxID=2940598 RepID=UPI0011CDDA28|nr:hypothetical protein [Chryseobacterium sp. BIGb0232]MCS4305104.1 hypothetical protein [Chryseobacterium sp. BIGb0232]
MSHQIINIVKGLNVLKIVVISIVTLLIMYLLYGFIKGFFVNIDTYISNSKKIELNNVHLISKQRLGYGLGTGSGTGKQEVKIFDGKKYYNLCYYEKNKADNQFLKFEYNNIPSHIFVIVNSDEMKDNKGTLENPIPVFNFSVNSKEMIWDDQSYQENIRKYLTYEK